MMTSSIFYLSWVSILLTIEITLAFYSPENNIKNCEKKSESVATIPEKREKKDHLIRSHADYGKKNYSNNMNCGWELTSSNGTGRFIIKILFFELEESKQCYAFDYMRIYKKGEGNIWDLGRDFKCGKQKPFVYRMWAKAIYIEFQTDSSVTRHGFNLTYNIEYYHNAPKIKALGEEGKWDRDVLVYERTEVTLKCVATGSPKPSIEWQRRDKNGKEMKIDPSSRKIGTSEDILVFESIKLTDAGIYGCSARNKYVESNEMIEEFLTLSIYEKCRCPKDIKAIWYSYYPYARYNTGFDIDGNPKHMGIIYQILDAMLQDVCGNCKEGHGKSIITWNGATNRKNTLDDVKKIISSGEFDVAFPLLHYNEMDTFYGYKFLHILKAPGFQYLKKPMANGGQKIFKALFGVYPICIITVVMIFLAGIVFWMLDSYWNEEELPRSVFLGLLHGSWWAYITMTTVGYGDKAPRGIPGRTFAVIWIMGGLVIISILTGAISTALTIASMKTTALVQTKMLAAINLTEEYRYGINRGSNMTGFENFGEITKKILDEDDELFGVLVDVYVAGYFKELHTLEKNNIISLDDRSYGVVFGDRMADADLHTLFKKFLEKKHLFIDLVVAANTNTVPDIPSFELVDPSSKMFTTSVLSLLGMLLVFSLAGLGFEYGYMKPRQRQIFEAKNLGMIESKAVKKLARSEQIMKDDLIHVMNQFQTEWKKRFRKIYEKQEREKQDFEADQADYIAKQKRKHSIEMLQQQRKLAKTRQTELEMQKPVAASGSNSEHKDEGAGQSTA